MQSKQYMPNLKWAQRKGTVFLTVEVRDLKNESIVLTETSLVFSGESDSKQYHFTLDFFAPIDKDESKWSKTGFSLRFNIVKKDDETGYWPRLSKEAKKNQFIFVDFDKWVDEDDQAEEGKKGLEGWDPSMMQGMGGMGGMPGMPGMGGMGGMPGMGGMGGMGGFPGMGGMGGFEGMEGLGGEDDEEGDGEEEKEGEHGHQHHEGCSHSHEHKEQQEKKE